MLIVLRLLSLVFMCRLFFVPLLRVVDGCLFFTAPTRWAHNPLKRNMNMGNANEGKVIPSDRWFRGQQTAWNSNWIILAVFAVYLVGVTLSREAGGA